MPLELNVAGQNGGAPIRGGGVAYVRRELRDKLYTYRKIRDCVAGAERVKQERTLYLPVPFVGGLGSLENRKRYADYIMRASFYNVTKRTVKGMLGQIYGRDPQIVMPASLEDFQNDMSGDGMSLVQIATNLSRYGLSYGRGGLLVDYPTTQDDVTRAQAQSGEIRPVLLPFAPWQIVNWRTHCFGSQEKLVLLIIYEGFGLQDDGFETTTGYQYRELRYDFEKNQIFCRVWRRSDYATRDAGLAPTAPQNAGGSGNLMPSNPVYLFDYQAQPITDMPFRFIGAENNTPSVDEAPLSDIVDLNLAHYRNSADYEEMNYLMGQPTYYFSGLSEDWVNNFLKNGVMLGSRQSIPLPVGATAGILQVSPNGALGAALDQKERQMAALGAQLVQQKTVQRTATEASIEDQASNSELGIIAVNTSDIMTWALKTACTFTGDNPDDVSFETNTSFDLAQLDPAERLQLMKEWQAGGIAWAEYREQLRKSGVTTLTDDEAQAAIEDEMSNVYGGTNPSVWDTALKPPPAVPVDSSGNPIAPTNTPALPPPAGGA